MVCSQTAMIIASAPRLGSAVLWDRSAQAKHRHPPARRRALGLSGNLGRGAWRRVGRKCRKMSWTRAAAVKGDAGGVKLLAERRIGTSRVEEML